MEPKSSRLEAPPPGGTPLASGRNGATGAPGPRAVSEARSGARKIETPARRRRARREPCLPKTRESPYRADSGETLVFDKAPERIVSLVPSITETLIELGAGNRVVGITNYCIHPARAVEIIPRLGGPKSISIEKIDALQPDLVITDKEENRETNIDPLRGKYPDVRHLRPRTVEHAVKMVSDLGAPDAHGDQGGRDRRDHAAARRLHGSRGRERASLDGVLYMERPVDRRRTGQLPRRPPREVRVPERLHARGRTVSGDRSRRHRRARHRGDPPPQRTLRVRRARAKRDRRVLLGQRPQGERSSSSTGATLTWFGYRTIQGLRFLRQAKARLLSETPQMP